MKTTRALLLSSLLPALIGPSLLVADPYEAAHSLRDRTRDKVTGQFIHPEWSEDGTTLTYSLRPTPGDDPERWRVELETGVRERVPNGAGPALIAWQAAGRCRSVSSTEETEVLFRNEAEHSIELYWVTSHGKRTRYATIEPGDQHAQHTFVGHAWLITGVDQQPIACLVAPRGPGTAHITRELCNNPPEPEPDPDNGRRPSRGSPDGRWKIRFQDHNAFLQSSPDSAPTPLTEDGNPENRYRGPVAWSPDSRHAVFLRRRIPDTRKVTLVASSPRDQVQPTVVTYNYPKPGDDIEQDFPVLVRLEDRAHIDIDNALFPNPWAIRGLHWAPDGSEFFFEYNQRGHQRYRVLGVNVAHGTVRTVIEESSDTFINYSNKIDARHLDATNELLWMSERDGWNHLYRVDRATGAIRQLTRGPWVVRDILRVDEEAGQVWFRAMGLDPDQDPYHLHYLRMSLDGTDTTRLTEGNGTHDVTFSPDRRYYIDTWSRVDQPPVHELRRAADGRLLRELGRADDRRLRATGWRAPEPFAAKGRDGKTDIWGVIYRPTHFDPSESYPVVEAIYAGPHGHHVPKKFSAYRTVQALAELGFVVVQIDGMGTNWRSKAFHDVAWKNLKDAGFPDRIAWMKAAAARYPSLDLSRVGIYGTSAGGQNAMRAVLDHHDFYRAAAADCGCHDNRMDKIWWNEAWMGWPVDESYASSSNVADAHKLGGALLLTVGELDRNVDPASTMQVVDALIRADKDFELIVFPGQGHGAGTGTYGRRRLYDFFTRHLAPSMPPSPPQALQVGAVHPPPTRQKPAASS